MEHCLPPSYLVKSLKSSPGVEALCSRTNVSLFVCYSVAGVNQQNWVERGNIR
ncbi:hypothetical protein FORC066_0647 [Yersinia enterocolitica]|nr:hypothetical protein FORC066_0647 [Yersinia enterocolitica]